MAMKSSRNSKIEIDSNTTLRPQRNLSKDLGDRIGRVAKKFFDYSQIIVIILGLFALLYLFIAQFSVVDGPSMEDNFKNGDLTIYEKITTSVGHLKRGDVVVFQAPDGRDFIKRVIGLPGESVKISGGKVYINNKPLEEDYLTETNKNVNTGTLFTEGNVVVNKDNEYDLFGDNRIVSHDSRYADIGPVNINKIKGKVMLVFWPISKIHPISDITYPSM